MSDPYLILGVADDADDDVIHGAYLAAIRACPPERDPGRFEAVRSAYEAVRTRRDRLAHGLFDTTAPEIDEILDRATPLQAPRRPSPELFAALLRGDD